MQDRESECIDSSLGRSGYSRSSHTHHYLHTRGGKQNYYYLLERREFLTNILSIVMSAPRQSNWMKDRFAPLAKRSNEDLHLCVKIQTQLCAKIQIKICTSALRSKRSSAQR